MWIVEKTKCDGTEVFIGAYDTKEEAEQVASYISFSYIRFVD